MFPGFLNRSTAKTKFNGQNGCQILGFRNVGGIPILFPNSLQFQ